MFEFLLVEINKRIRFHATNCCYCRALCVGPSAPGPGHKLLLPTFEISEEMEPNAKHLVSFFVFLFLRDEKFFIAGEDQGKLYLVDADDAK